jgi:hypothetical protein
VSATSRDAAIATTANSTSASTAKPDGLVAQLAAAARQALAAGSPLPRSLRSDLARLLVDGGVDAAQ